MNRRGFVPFTVKADSYGIIARCFGFIAAIGLFLFAAWIIGPNPPLP